MRESTERFGVCPLNETCAVCVRERERETVLLVPPGRGIRDLDVRPIEIVIESQKTNDGTMSPI